MKTKLYTIRLDEEVMNILDNLARKTHRSKTGVIRWLIYQANDIHICRNGCSKFIKQRDLADFGDQYGASIIKECSR